MLREAENRVKIEGVLSEIDLKYGSFMKGGKPVETIGGVIKIQGRPANWWCANNVRNSRSYVFHKVYQKGCSQSCI